MSQALFADAGGCWVCGSEAFSSFDAAEFDLTAYRDQDPDLAGYTGARVALRRCRRCGFAQPDRVPALPGFFERMYNQLWSPEWVAREFSGTSKDLIFDRVLSRLEQALPPDRRSLLDVGSHAGRFLAKARSRGWTVQGIEVNERTARHAEARTSAPVHRMSAHDVDSLGERFDAVTMTDVLEHLPDPVGVLGRARRVLAPGGWVAVKVPCGPSQRLKEHARSWIRRGYTPRLAGNLVHLNHFSVRALRLALERAGFDAIAIEVGAPETAGNAASNAARRALFAAARATPFGVHLPIALNLQAFAQRQESGA